MTIELGNFSACNESCNLIDPNEIQDKSLDVNLITAKTWKIAAIILGIGCVSLVAIPLVIPHHFSIPVQGACCGILVGIVAGGLSGALACFIPHAIDSVSLMLDKALNK